VIFGLFVSLLALTGGMRLVELAVSVRRMRARPQDVVAEPALFPAMAALHTALIGLPIAEVVLTDRPALPLVTGAALAVLGVATALRVWTLHTLGAAWNVRVLPPEAVVTDGPYAWIRHPNYLVVILEIAALPLVHGAWISAVVLSIANAAVLAVRIPTEERALAALPAWRAAMAHKPRFLPRLDRSAPRG
jgi:methyltransferase